MTIHGDDFAWGFRQLGVYSREVMMEMMSKAGTAIQKSMRASLSGSRSVNTRTMGGRLVKAGSPREFGRREDFHTGEDLAPKSMANFINSFPAERSDKVIVAGSHPSFVPILRRDGKVVGVGAPVKGVGSRTTAILQRMDSGIISKDYPKRTQLSQKNIGTHWASKGRAAANGAVNSYLGQGYEKALGRAMNNISPRQMRIVL